MQTPELIGKLVKPRGYKGEIQLFVTHAGDIEFKKLEFVFLNINGVPTPYFVEDVIFSGKKIFLKLENVNSDKEADGLKNLEVLIPADKITELIDDSEFTGFTIEDAELGEIGKIIRTEEYPSSEMWIVLKEGKEIMIPVTDQFIIEINYPSKKIRYQAPEGLFEL